jgi:DNA (cytosine-5)-methyltransferase 1
MDVVNSQASRQLRYLSLFSGIGSCATAIERLGLPWEAVAFAENDPAACAVLAQHGRAPNLGDIRTVDFRPFRGEVDLVLGGPPCQDFSVAGKQAGSAGARGAMLGEYLRALEQIRPRWAVLENVPGLLGTGTERGTNRGGDFGALIGRLGDIGFRSISWRILDSRFCGVPQRRRRLWLVCDRRGGDGPDRVLGLPQSGLWHPAEGGEEEEMGSTPAPGSPPGDNLDRLIGWQRPAQRQETGCDPTALAADWRNLTLSRVAPTLTIGGEGISLNVVPGIIFHADTHNLRIGQVAQTLRSDSDAASSHQGCALLHDGRRWVARRLTPRECGRLQGLDDSFWDGVLLRGRPLTDAAKYRLIGNSWTIPVTAWVLERLAAVDALKSSGKRRFVPFRGDLTSA